MADSNKVRQSLHRAKKRQVSYLNSWTGKSPTYVNTSWNVHRVRRGQSNASDDT